MFFERFDVGPYDPALVPAAKGFYYNRNRPYEPVTARFMTRDPNGTTSLPEPLFTALGEELCPCGRAADGHCSSCGGCGGGECGCGCGNSSQPERVTPAEQYADGMNLYVYERSRPVEATDPRGLDLGFTPIGQLGVQSINEEVDADLYIAEGQSVRLSFGLVARVLALQLLYEAVIKDIFIDITGGPRGKKCHCMCIKPDPHRPGQNILDGPLSGFTDGDDCRRIPYTSFGEVNGYTKCWCKGDKFGNGI